MIIMKLELEEPFTLNDLYKFVSLALNSSVPGTTIVNNFDNEWAAEGIAVWYEVDSPQDKV